MANSVPPRPDVEGMRRGPRVSDDMLGRLCIVAERSDGCMIQGDAVLGNSLSLDLRDCRAALAAETKRADVAEKAIAHESYACYMEGWLDAAESVELHIANAAWEKSVSKERIGQTTVVAELLARADAAESALAAETAARIAAEAKVGEMRAELTTAIEALRPLALEADHFEHHDCSKEIRDVGSEITVGDLLRAARLVAQHDAKGKEAGDA